jgi:hypothetical protein
MYRWLPRGGGGVVFDKTLMLSIFSSIAAIHLIWVLKIIRAAAQ